MNLIEEIAALLHIYEKASAHGGALGHIAAAAYERLKQLDGNNPTFRGFVPPTYAGFSPEDRQDEPPTEPPPPATPDGKPLEPTETSNG
jgi:hypothetical protein